MKKVAVLTLSLLILSALFVGCETPQHPQKQTTAIANPWSDWDSLSQAEAAVGFPLDLPEVIADSYRADAFRTLNSQLLEVIYRDGDYEVRVRKQKGEGQDISGDYNQYDTCTEESFPSGTVTTYRNTGSNGLRQLISCQGYSWSLTAPQGYWGDSGADFVNLILGE